MEEERRIDADAQDAPDETAAEATEHESDALAENLNLDNIVLALLFAAEEPLSVRRMSAVIEDAAAAQIKEALERWHVRMDEEAWSIRVEQVGGGYRLATRPDFAPYVSRLYSGRRRFRLSKAGLETLAIVAYKQPVTRAEIENIRGVACGGVIANLMERSLVKITGKARVLGAPFLYGTTPEFLEYLGLNSLKDLPSIEELEALLEREAFSEMATDETIAAAPSDDAAEDAADADVADVADADEVTDTPRAGTARVGRSFDARVAEDAAPADEDAGEPDAEAADGDEDAQGDVSAD